MINYTVDEENKVVTCVLDGDEVTYSAVRKISAMLNNQPKNTIYFVEEDYMLADEYVGTAKYCEDEEDKPFNAEQGKIIARKKAFAKYNKAMTKKLRLFQHNLASLSQEALFQVFNFDSKVKEIERKIKKY